MGCSINPYDKRSDRGRLQGQCFQKYRGRLQGSINKKYNLAPVLDATEKYINLPTIMKSSVEKEINDKRWYLNKYQNFTAAIIFCANWEFFLKITIFLKFASAYIWLNISYGLSTRYGLYVAHLYIVLLILSRMLEMPPQEHFLHWLDYGDDRYRRQLKQSC